MTPRHDARTRSARTLIEKLEQFGRWHTDHEDRCPPTLGVTGDFAHIAGPDDLTAGDLWTAAAALRVIDGLRDAYLELLKAETKHHGTTHITHAGRCGPELNRLLDAVSKTVLPSPEDT